ncbi:MAG: hypothetical protein DRQ78_10950 [Epsilonproteobacteria bacterium]|nr:MAG: hypothetical protein DRQ78_10950 [Campylobacterota bacterium]
MLSLDVLPALDPILQYGNLQLGDFEVLKCTPCCRAAGVLLNSPHVEFKKVTQILLLVIKIFDKIIYQN